MFRRLVSLWFKIWNWSGSVFIRPESFGFLLSCSLLYWNCDRLPFSAVFRTWKLRAWKYACVVLRLCLCVCREPCSSAAFRCGDISSRSKILTVRPPSWRTLSRYNSVAGSRGRLRFSSWRSRAPRLHLLSFSGISGGNFSNNFQAAENIFNG